MTWWLNEIAVILIVYAIGLVAALTIDPGHRRR